MHVLTGPGLHKNRPMRSQQKRVTNSLFRLRQRPVGSGYPRLRLIIALLLIFSGCTQSPEAAITRSIRAVERGLRITYGDPPWKRMNLSERMTHHNVPGVSIAVINDYQVEWAKGYGMLEAGKDIPVTPDTLFQTASIAKPIVAVAALHYVEQGHLHLDSDVNRALVSWKIPQNAFLLEEKVTLRRLLSHSAGVILHGFRGYRQGEALPTLQQILNGEPPANSPPIHVDFIPGTRKRYSGGGYMIVQQLLEDAVGKPLPEIMQEVVLDPWDMTTSTFEAPLPRERWSSAASGHRANGHVVYGRWHNYPEIGAGASMWSTPSDMARFTIGVMLAYADRSDEVLSHEMAVQMLTPQIEAHGLGPVLGDDGGDRFYFFHSGANDGYATYMVGYPERGQGVVIMTNSDGGKALCREILNSVSEEYGWVKDNTTLYVSIILTAVFALAAFLFLRKRRTKS